MDSAFRRGSLVLYKARPARIVDVGDRLLLELDGDEQVKVRAKDVLVLHPGPLDALGELRPVAGDVQTAWEILAGDSTTLREFAELAYGSYTPATAWAAWQLAADGLYFHGTPDALVARSPAEVGKALAARAAEAREKDAWERFLARARLKKLEPSDERYLRDVQELALGRGTRSRMLKALGSEESPENAHAFLLEVRAWDETVNPYPQRCHVELMPPSQETPQPEAEMIGNREHLVRTDLSHMTSLAIDDGATETPDDALGLEGAFPPETGTTRLWVHVADPASAIGPGHPLDLEAQARGATLYLPEGSVPMLPLSATPLFGLGLADVSPALSLAIDLDGRGEIQGLQIVPSTVRVQRLTYEEAEGRLDEEPLAGLLRLAQVYEAHRRASGSVSIELPEVTLSVRNGQVEIRPVGPLRSRALVENAMILAGDAVARFAMDQSIPLPFAVQSAPDESVTIRATTLSEMFAQRRTLKRSHYQTTPAPHSGLGLQAYVQVTSPMRRYLDLVVHQQLRAYLSARSAHGSVTVLSAADVLERIGAAEAALSPLRQAEQLSRRHWTLVYLLQHPGWEGVAIVAERRGHSTTVVIPELAFETQVHLPADLPLDSQVRLALMGVDLARLDARFRVVGSERPLSI